MQNKRLQRAANLAAKRIASEEVKRCGGNHAEAARQLGINRVTLYRWLAINKGVR